MSQARIDRLQAALAAEHAAIFGYSRLGVLLDAAGKGEAHTAQEAHRARRDALLVELAKLEATPVAAAAGYALPFPLADAPSALKLAATIEDGVAANWRAALRDTEADLRKFVLDGYTDAARRGVRWRRLAGIGPLTIAYPGRQTPG